MESTTIKIEGMSCMGCVRSVSGVLQALPGVSRAEVSLERAEAQVEFDPGRVTASALREAVAKAGFQAV